MHEQASTLSGKLIEHLAKQFGWNPNLDLTALQYVAGNRAFCKICEGEQLEPFEIVDLQTYIKGVGCNPTCEGKKNTIILSS